MNDLIVAVILVGIVSAAVLIAALRLGKRLAPRTANLLAILIVSLLMANALLWQDSILLTRLLPFSGLLILGNGAPPLVAALAGIVWNWIPHSLVHRILIIGSLTGTCLIAIYYPILAGPPTNMVERWDEGVCLQTSRASCSAAAAATLLSRYEIDASETEMALLCFTTDKGTTMHGLYRGLKIKAATRGYDVEMFTDGTIESLRNSDGPVLLAVELRRNSHADPAYESTWGWMPGVPHSVVVLGFTTADQVIIADPSTGREKWSIKDLAVLWHGVGARLVKRSA